MTRDADLPQTVDEAATCGWPWLTIECRGCRRRGEFKLVDLPSATRLASLARKLTCQSCQGRRAYVSLGTTIITEGAQPWADTRRIAFDGDRVVRPLRD